MNEFESVYKFEMDSYGKTKITLEGRNVTIMDVLDDFKDFLKGSGFSPTAVDKITYEG